MQSEWLVAMQVVALSRGAKHLRVISLERRDVPLEACIEANSLLLRSRNRSIDDAKIDVFAIGCDVPKPWRVVLNRVSHCERHPQCIARHPGFQLCGEALTLSNTRASS